MLLIHDIENFATVECVPKGINFYETMPLDLTCHDVAIAYNYLQTTVDWRNKETFLESTHSPFFPFKVKYYTKYNS